MKKRIISVLLIVVLLIMSMSMGVVNAHAASEVIESALAWGLQIANDDTHQYVYGASHSSEGTHYDCSSFVSWALRHAGIGVPISTTYNMKENFSPYGFTWTPWSSSGGTANLQRGDILLDIDKHVEFYYGNNQILGAHKPATGISVMSYYNNAGGVSWDGILRYNRDPVPTLTVDSNYSRFLPLTAYIVTDYNIDVYERDLSSKGGEIYTTDQCSIKEIYNEGWCYVSYPAGNSTKEKYVPLAEFMPIVNAELQQVTAKESKDVYRLANLSERIGSIDPGDVCYKVGTYDSKVQVIYPLNGGGYKLGWTTDDWPEPIVVTPDIRFNPYCPIHSYLLENSNQNAYERDFSTWDGISEVFGTDNCDLTDVYSNGWCEVSYPTSSGRKTKYLPLSCFVKDTSATPEAYTATEQVTTYIRSDLSNNIGWLSPNDKFFKVSTSGNAVQVLYPVDEQYGGGYRLAWIEKSKLPVPTYSVTYNANGGSGAPSNQTKKHDEVLILSSTIPKRTGYTFAGWSISSTSTDIKYEAGARYTGNSALSLYAVWTPNKYTVSFDLNGGIGDLDEMIIAYNSKATIPSTDITKVYSIYLDSCDESIDNKYSTSSCDFLGWSTTKTNTIASYSAGDSLTITEDITLYAVWSNPTIGTLPAISKEGYKFLGWYTSEAGGTKVDSSTEIYDDIAVYAHWEKALEPITPTEPLDPSSSKFVVSQVKAQADSTITVDVSIENNPSITSFNYQITYPDTLTLVGVEYKDLFSSRANGSNKMQSPFTMSWFSTNSEDEDANGTIATMTFKVSADAQDGKYPIILTYDEDNVFDSTYTNKHFDIVNGYVEVVSSIPGDINGDTKVNMKDIVLLQQYLNGWNVSVDETSANVNGDASINMKDIVLLQQYLNGWSVTLK